MNINYKEAQFELFPAAVNAPDETKRPHFMAARFNLSIENLVIFSISSIMVVIFTFSLGVERGKRMASRETSDAGTQEVSSRVVAPADPVKAVPVQVQKTMDKAIAAAALKKGVVVALPAAVVSSAGAVSKPAGGFTVQVASYKTEKSAQKEVQALLKKGYKAFVLPRGQHVILCVGNFQKKEDASILGKKLKSNYQDFLVRRL